MPCTEELIQIWQVLYRRTYPSLTCKEELTSIWIVQKNVQKFKKKKDNLHRPDSFPCFPRYWLVQLLMNCFFFNRLINIAVWPCMRLPTPCQLRYVNLQLNQVFVIYYIHVNLLLCIVSVLMVSHVSGWVLTNSWENILRQRRFLARLRKGTLVTFTKKDTDLFIYLIGVLHTVQEHFTYRMGASIIGWEQTGHNLGWNPWPSVVCWTNLPIRTGEGDSLRWLTWLTFFQLRQTTLNSTPPVCEASFKGAQHTTCQKKAANVMLSRLLWKCDAYVSMLLLSCVYIYICTWLHCIM